MNTNIKKSIAEFTTANVIKDTKGKIMKSLTANKNVFLDLGTKLLKAIGLTIFSPIYLLLFILSVPVLLLTFIEFPEA